MERLNETLTGFPFWIPGFHLGMFFTTLIASLSHPPPIPRKTFTWETDPSGSTTK